MADLDEDERARLAETRLAEARAAERAKSLFLASMSHEIRTPLNAVIGLSQELQNDDLPPAVRQRHLRAINTASRALLDLINDVLDISKLESGRLTFAKDETGLAELVGGCGDIFADLAARRGLSLTVNVPDAAYVARIDPHRVRQVLVNLLGNAVKFTKRGGVTLTCAFAETDAASGTLRFSVADTGIGISEEDQSRVFGMFEQASGLRGTRVANAGTGLGLALCQRLASAMGGTLSLQSELGKGSVFTLTLPRVAYRRQTAAERDAARRAAENEARPLDFKGKVLVVDDVPLNLKVMEVLLARAHVPCVAVGSGEAALAALEREPFAALLTDLWMPDMSGEELARCVRADARFAGLRIAAVTADMDVAHTFDPSCFEAILSKPITLPRLLDFLRGGGGGVGPFSRQTLDWRDWP